MAKKEQFLSEVRLRIRRILARELTPTDEKLAIKLMYKRYTPEDAVAVMLTKI